ncbi:MAG TPA: nitrilase-related carbon-nitrogen hydrolase [Thermoanaerobaculia bacterium]|jgi:apolipoprotein N-acyltransferase|nr:nitrilase-related carbon-nitrogen hydrolase [Thermoanaerobaculia bacterium]
MSISSPEPAAPAARPRRSPAPPAPPAGQALLARATLAALTTGALYCTCIGLRSWWPGAWLAPLPVLLFAFTSPPRWAAATAFAAMVLGQFNIFAYLMTFTPLPVTALIVMVPAAVFAAAVLLARGGVRAASIRAASAGAAGAAGGRGVAGAAAAWLSGALAALAFPAAWTAYAYLLSVTSPHGTAGDLAYSQVDFLPVLQLASLTGLWGIDFVVALLPAGLAAAWYLRRARPAGSAGAAAAAALTVTLVLVAAALVFGWLRLARPAPAARPGASAGVRVGLAATDATVRYFRTERAEEALPVVQAYARRIGALADRGARVVVLPEKFVGVAPAYASQAIAILAAAARDHHVFVVAGLNRVGERPPRNVALVLGPDGTQLVEYDKAHPLPAFESSYRVGRTPALLSLPAGTAGVAICKDMDFPGWLRRYSAAGRPGLLLVPAWDFVRDGRWHARMAVVRGVESGFTLARAAQNGLVTASDDRGRILAEAGSDPEAMVVADLPLGPGQTFYSRHGDWAGIVSLLLVGAALAAAFARRSVGTI